MKTRRKSIKELNKEDAIGFPNRFNHTPKQDEWLQSLIILDDVYGKDVGHKLCELSTKRNGLSKITMKSIIDFTNEIDHFEFNKKYKKIIKVIDEYKKGI